MISVIVQKTCQELWDAFLKDRANAKPATLSNFRSCQKLFYGAFSPTESIEAITPSRLLTWKQSLQERYQRGGITSRLNLLSTVLQWAVGCGWLTTNPMKNVKRDRGIDREKHRDITQEDLSKLLEACPNQEWRKIIVLARIGGLRCPSEIQKLRWLHIDWKRNRFLVHSPKTEHHPGHHQREVPLFPELRKALQQHFELVNPNDNDFVIQSFQGKDCWCLTIPFAKISKAAGLGKIAQPFLNMRRSRSNEVVRKFGPTRENRWFGHTTEVMEDHYFSMKDEDFDEAAGDEVLQD